MESNTPAIKPQSTTVPAFNFFDPVQFETMQRVCKLFAHSELVPDMYRVSKDNPEAKAMANCMVAVEISQRIGASPLMIMQNMTPIYGRPAWSSKFLVATVNTCGRFNPLQYKFRSLGKVGKVIYIEYEWNDQLKKKLPKNKEFDGSNVENLECIAYTTAKGSDSCLESSPITVHLAVVEGWYTKSGSKWKTMTRQMLMYRAASWWTSVYAPELSMGMKTEEEIRDIEDIPYEDVTPKNQAPNSKKIDFEDQEHKSTVSEEVPQDQPQQITEPEKKGPDF